MLTLVANGAPPPPSLLRTLAKKSEGVVAIDGGLAACDHAGIEPDLILGDLDSASRRLLEKFSHVPQIETPDPNKTDLEKAVEWLLNFRFESLIVCGALGKRIDHTLTNICLLCRFPGKIKFETKNETCFALPKTSIIECKKGQKISLLPVNSEVLDLSTHGLKWEINKKTLNKDFVSISNEAVEEKIRISFKEGNLIITINT
ncbi:MAG: thiamine diphosphokinase [Chlamydiales bacterium]|nr:thiamine diphosphokinase [Chlamydiales bacterium]